MSTETSAAELLRVVNAPNFYSVCCADPSISGLLSVAVVAQKISSIRSGGLEAAERYRSHKDIQRIYRTVAKEMMRRRALEALRQFSGELSSSSAVPRPPRELDAFSAAPPPPPAQRNSCYVPPHLREYTSSAYPRPTVEHAPERGGRRGGGGGEDGTVDDVLSAYKHLLGVSQPPSEFSDGNLGLTALHQAAQNGQASRVRRILRQGRRESHATLAARANVTSQLGYTPAHLATIAGSVACLKLLRAAGADMYLRDSSGKSCLDYALAANDEEVVAFLLDDLPAQAEGEGTDFSAGSPSSSSSEEEEEDDDSWGSDNPDAMPILNAFRTKAAERTAPRASLNVLTTHTTTSSSSSSSTADMPPPPPPRSPQLEPQTSRRIGLCYPFQVPSLSPSAPRGQEEVLLRTPVRAPTRPRSASQTNSTETTGSPLLGAAWSQWIGFGGSTHEEEEEEEEEDEQNGLGSRGDPGRNTKSSSVLLQLPLSCVVTADTVVPELVAVNHTHCSLPEMTTSSTAPLSTTTLTTTTTTVTKEVVATLRPSASGAEEVAAELTRLRAIVEHQRLQLMALEDQVHCKVCMERPLETVLFPCMHHALCIHCAKSIQSSNSAHCPICMCAIEQVLKVFHS